jgi:hypothetical protein
MDAKLMSAMTRSHHEHLLSMADRGFYLVAFIASLAALHVVGAPLLLAMYSSIVALGIGIGTRRALEHRLNKSAEMTAHESESEGVGRVPRLRAAIVCVSFLANLSGAVAIASVVLVSLRPNWERHFECRM